MSQTDFHGCPPQPNLINIKYISLVGQSFCSSFSSGIVGSVVECPPATRAARVRFPDDASYFCPRSAMRKKQKKKGGPHASGQEQNVAGDGGYRSPYLSHAKRALYHLSYVPLCTPCPVLIRPHSDLERIFGTE